MRTTKNCPPKKSFATYNVNFYKVINSMICFFLTLKWKTSLYLFKFWILKGKFTDDYFVFFFTTNRDGAVIIFLKNVPVKQKSCNFIIVSVIRLL